MRQKILQSRYFYRFAERLVPILVWAAITMPIWLSPFHPAVASYLILAYFLYFLYKSTKTVYFAGISYRLINRSEKINWYSKVSRKKNFHEIYHFFIIANYKETTSKLRKTLDRLAEQNYPKDKIYIVLAMEEREGDIAKERGIELTKEYKSTFADFYTTYHRLIDGEVVGKASNGTHAAKFISKIVKNKGIKSDKVIITVCDADSLMPKNYLAYVTYKFLLDKDRKYRFFWAPVLLYSNFWKLPLPVRVQSILSSVARFAYLSQKDDLIQISTYSTNLWLLEEVGYWDTDIIPEDWHVYLQAYFTFGEKVKTIPMFLTITRDAVRGSNLYQSLLSRYEQEKRWAWGVTDVPYALRKLLTTPHLPWLPKFFKVVHVLETHLFWPTSFFILTLGASIPALVNPAFNRTALGHNLPRMSGLILTITTSFIAMLIFIDLKSRPKRPLHFSVAKTPLLLFQWVLLPVVSFFLSSLPAL